MNLVSKFSLIAIVALTIFSCKEKAVEAAVESAMAPSGIKYMTNDSLSVIGWEGSKPTGTHNGTIKLSEGTVYVNDSTVTAGSFTIDMNSMIVLDLEGEYKTNLEDHLKGTVAGKEVDFFNVTKYPTAKFEVTEIKSVGDQPNANSIVTGNLTMLDSTKVVTFPASISIDAEKVSIATEPFTINRTDWGIKYGSKSFFDDLKDKFIDDEIKLRLNILANIAPVQE